MSHIYLGVTNFGPNAKLIIVGMR